MTGPRDWDKEMAEIDKIIASGKSAPASGPPALSAPAREGQPKSNVPDTRSTAPIVTRGRHKLAVWFRALVGVGGVVALQIWPYGNSCGTMLYLYVLTAFMVTLVGVWTMRASWTHRRGVAHVGGLLVLIAGLIFAAIQILERTGYAAVRLGWTCP